LDLKQTLADARATRNVDSVSVVRDQLRESSGSLETVASAVLVDLMLSFRAVRGWDEMVQLYSEMPVHLQETVLVREQLAFGLNRLGRWDEAERVLQAVLDERGPSSETCGLLGRIFKDRWQQARNEGHAKMAARYLDKAIRAYREGFETDWRDAYPGINVVTLMELREPPDPDRAKLIAVVRYAAERRLAGAKADYWDHATLLELAVLGRDEDAARSELQKALYLVREPWEPESTARNIRLLCEARRSRGEETGWVEDIVSCLIDGEIV
jgi:tetratricopeptide (TPR) repeat protein